MDYVKQTKEFINRAYTGDIEGAKEMLSTDIVLEMGGKNQLSGQHIGRDGFFENFGKLLEITNGTYKMTKEYDWLNGTNRAVLIAQEFAERNGKKYYFDRVVEYVFTDDKISKVKIYEGDPFNVDEVFR